MREVNQKTIMKKYNPNTNSARYRYLKGDTITHKGKKLQLIDKIIMPMNRCPNCKSKNTYHYRVQKNKDFTGNVWNSQRHEYQKSVVLTKFDYCFNCSKEFLIEMFMWQITKRTLIQKIKYVLTKKSRKGYEKRTLI